MMFVHGCLQVHELIVFFVMHYYGVLGFYQIQKRSYLSYLLVVLTYDKIDILRNKILLN